MGAGPGVRSVLPSPQEPSDRPKFGNPHRAPRRAWRRSSSRPRRSLRSAQAAAPRPAGGGTLGFAPRRASLRGRCLRSPVAGRGAARGRRSGPRCGCLQHAGRADPWSAFASVVAPRGGRVGREPIGQRRRVSPRWEGRTGGASVGRTGAVHHADGLSEDGRGRERSSPGAGSPGRRRSHAAPYSRRRSDRGPGRGRPTPPWLGRNRTPPAGRPGPGRRRRPPGRSRGSPDLGVERFQAQPLATACAGVEEVVERRLDRGRVGPVGAEQDAPPATDQGDHVRQQTVTAGPGADQVVDQDRARNAEPVPKDAGVGELLRRGAVGRDKFAGVRFPGVEKDRGDALWGIPAAPALALSARRRVRSGSRT